MFENPKEENKKARKSKKINTEVLLRETATNYIRLIADADRKARIMLVVNSIFLTISVTLISKAIENIPYSWIFASILMLSNVLSLFFSVQSVKPEFARNKNEVLENNILHYKKCEELTLDEYSSEIMTTMQDNAKKMDAFIKELYFYGKLLTIKYKLLKTAYYFFSWGILLAVLTYVFIMIMVSQQS